MGRMRLRKLSFWLKPLDVDCGEVFSKYEEARAEAARMLELEQGPLEILELFGEKPGRRLWRSDGNALETSLGNSPELAPLVVPEKWLDKRGAGT